MPDVTREQAAERLTALHEAFKHRWYGLDNASDEQIINAILFGVMPEGEQGEPPQPDREYTLEERQTMEREQEAMQRLGMVTPRLPWESLPGAGARRF